jgi:hypothetical protein
MIVSLSVKITRNQFEKLRSMRKQHSSQAINAGTDAQFAAVVLAAAIEDRFDRQCRAKISDAPPMAAEQIAQDDFADDEVIGLAPGFDTAMDLAFGG